MAVDVVTREEMEQLQIDVGSVRDLFIDLNARFTITAGAVDRQEGFLKESVLAELVQRDELINSIQHALAMRTQAIEALTSRVQGIEVNDIQQMESVLRRTELIERDAALHPSAGATPTTPPPEFDSALQQAMDTMEEMKLQLTERGNVCVHLEARQVEMTQELTDLKFEVNEVGPTRQADVEAKFEKITSEFHKILLQETEQLTGVNEKVNELEHRVQNLEITQEKTEYDFTFTVPGMAREINSVQTRIDAIERNGIGKGGGKGAGTHPKENLTKHKTLDKLSRYGGQPQNAIRLGNTRWKCFWRARSETTGDY